VLFGIGAGLTLDEFALWLYLEDVYWTDQGRLSVDAVVVASLFAGLFLIALPLDPGDSVPTAVGFGLIALNVVICSIVFLKGKFVLGLIGLFVPLVADVAAIRLARPSSPWARWAYRHNERKLARAQQRELRWARRRIRWSDLVGGTPTEDEKSASAKPPPPGTPSA
jgi:hypothetical protein